MSHQKPKKPGAARSLLNRLFSSEDDSPDLLLQSEVNSAIAQLSAFGRRGRNQTNPNRTIASAAETRALSGACNTFGFRLFHLLIEANKQNVFISPLSIILALGMVYNGANGATQQAMAQTLALGDMNLEA